MIVVMFQEYLFVFKMPYISVRRFCFYIVNVVGH